MLGQADDVWAWCARAQAFGRTVTVKVKYADFRQVTRARTLPVAVSGRAAIRRIALDLLSPLEPVERGVRLLGVTLSNLDRTSGEPVEGQLGLFP